MLTLGMIARPSNVNAGDCITTGLGRKFSDPHCLAEQS